MENKKIRVALTHGDTNGIGYELIFKAFAEPEMFEFCTPVIYGSPKIAAYHCKALDVQGNFSIINTIVYGAVYQHIIRIIAVICHGFIQCFQCSGTAFCSRSA